MTITTIVLLSNGPGIRGAAWNDKCRAFIHTWDKKWKKYKNKKELC
jgi:hypothetical protein